MSIIADSIAKIGVGYGVKAVASLGFLSQKVQEGRSGYWRLFFTQLQEDALKPKEAEKQPEAFKEPYTLEEQSDGSVDVVFGKKPVSKVRPVEQAQETKTPVQRPIVVPLQETTIFESARLVAQVQLMLVQYVGHNVALKNKKVVVTDDEEEDIELLLLAA